MLKVEEKKGKGEERKFKKWKKRKKGEVRSKKRGKG